MNERDIPAAAAQDAHAYESDEDRDRLAAIQEQGKQMLNSLFICMRMAHLYDPANEAFQKPMGGLKAKMDGFFAEFGEIKMMFAEGEIYLNDIRVKLDASSYEWISEMIKYFTDRQIGGVRVIYAPRKESLTGFFHALSRVPKKVEGGAESGREVLIKKLADANIKEIHPMRLMTLADDDDVSTFEENKGEAMSQSVGMYITGLKSVKNMVLGGGQSTGSLLQLTKVVQGLSDAEAGLGGNILSLVTIKNCEHFLLSHSMNVCVLSLVLGKKLGLSKAELCDLSLGALLHDIGQFWKEEGDDTYQLHPYRSFKFIMRARDVTRSLMTQAMIALDHHVSYDGKSGFPTFRVGFKPHIFARIVSIADAFDSLTTPGADGTALLPELALRSILKKSGTMFDPALAQVFAESLGKYPVGSLVEIDNGDIGIVVKSGRGESRMTRPIVMLARDRFGTDVKGVQLVDLAERKPGKKAFLHSIVCSHDPAAMGINVSGYLMEFSGVLSAVQAEKAAAAAG